MLYKFEKFSIEVWHNIENEKYGNIDFCVYAENKKYFGSAFSLKSIEKVMQNHSKTGENKGGIYFWTTGLIILSEITIDNLYRCICNIIEEDQDLLKEVLHECNQ